MSDDLIKPVPISLLLTGGAGFLGSAIVAEILSDDAPVKITKLRIFDLTAYEGPEDPRIEMVKGDIRDSEALSRACQGMDAVIHSAAIVDWGTNPEEEVFKVNYGGTKLVIDACKQNGIRYLVFTSSVDAIYTGTSMVDIDESIPYPEKFPNMYCKSKSLAEQLVLESNCDQLITSALRPTDIYGPGDPYHIGSLIEMAKGGFYVRLGDGSSRSQHTFVGNIAMAHLQLLHAQMSGNRKVPGSVYFITDGPGSNFFKFFDAIVAGAGYRIWPSDFWIPRPVAYAMGFVSELIARIVRPVKKYNPKFSRFAVIYTCNDFTFSAAKAISDFGFSTKYSEEEAFNITIRYYNGKH